MFSYLHFAAGHFLYSVLFLPCVCGKTHHCGFGKPGYWIPRLGGVTKAGGTSQKIEPDNVLMMNKRGKNGGCKSGRKKGEKSDNFLHMQFFALLSKGRFVKIKLFCLLNTHKKIEKRVLSSNMRSSFWGEKFDGWLRKSSLHWPCMHEKSLPATLSFHRSLEKRKLSMQNNCCGEKKEQKGAKSPRGTASSNNIWMKNCHAELTEIVQWLYNKFQGQNVQWLGYFYINAQWICTVDFA